MITAAVITLAFLAIPSIIMLTLFAMRDVVKGFVLGMKGMSVAEVTRQAFIESEEERKYVDSTIAAARNNMRAYDVYKNGVRVNTTRTFKNGNTVSIYK